jgi:hypothetical protein
MEATMPANDYDQIPHVNMVLASFRPKLKPAVEATIQEAARMDAMQAVSRALHAAARNIEAEAKAYAP